MQYFFSGVDKPALLEILARQGACGMVNALSAGQPALLDAYVRYGSVPLALDSGGYQGYADIEAYACLIKTIGPRMQWCANLDALHNQHKSDEHYRRLTALLADDERVRNKLLWIYQCQSAGNRWSRQGHLDALKRALEHHRFVGIGGLVSVITRSLFEAEDLLEQIGEILDAAQAQAHLFGLGNFTLLVQCSGRRRFRSADSSRWLQGLKSRTLLAIDGTTLNASKLTWSGLQCAEQNVGAVHSWLKPGMIHQLALFPDSDQEESAAPPRLLWPLEAR